MKAFTFFPVLLLLGLEAGCTSTPRCLASNCAGCCDVNNACQMGSEKFACGKGANMCKTCSPSERCESGDCVASDGGEGGGSGGDGGCGPANCGGCCDTSGTCRGGNTNSLCGSRGRTCAMCPSSQSCQFQDGGTFSCAAFVCQGCIATNGNCLLGSSVTACGSDGGTCRSCLSGQSCVDGTCQTAATCSPNTCAGCCDGTLCVDPPTTPKCGRMGVACAPCSGTNVCNAGICGSGAGGGGGAGGGSGSGCGPSNCATGCCDPLFNLCQAGDTNLLCGNGGGTCIPCILGLTCKSKMCSF